MPPQAFSVHCYVPRPQSARPSLPKARFFFPILNPTAIITATKTYGYDSLHHSWPAIYCIHRGIYYCKAPFAAKRRLRLGRLLLRVRGPTPSLRKIHKMVKNHIWCRLFSRPAALHRRRHLKSSRSPAFAAIQSDIKTPASLGPCTEYPKQAKLLTAKPAMATAKTFDYNGPFVRVVKK